jgi:hypothetical protein
MSLVDSFLVSRKHPTLLPPTSSRPGQAEARTHTTTWDDLDPASNLPYPRQGSKQQPASRGYTKRPEARARLVSRCCLLLAGWSHVAASKVRVPTDANGHIWASRWSSRRRLAFTHQYSEERGGLLRTSLLCSMHARSPLAVRIFRPNSCSYYYLDPINVSR